MKLNPHLSDFWKSPEQIKILYGGRASSKTEDTAGVIMHIACHFKVKIACVRMFQANIKDSVYSVFKKKIENDEYFKPKFTFTDKNIRSSTGSELIFLGWERNTEQIKGLDNIDIMWIEEGHTLTKEQWEIIEPTVTLRKNDTMIIILFNPSLETDFIYKNFVMKKKKGVKTHQINYDRNVFLPENAVNKINIAKEEWDEDDFNHIYLGIPKAESEDAFIKRKWIEAAIDAHIKLDIEIVGEKIIGYDIGDTGTDPCATVRGHGILTEEIKEWKAKEDELDESAIKVYNDAEEHGAEIVYDCIGIGASAGSTFKRVNAERTYSHVIYNKFDAGAPVENPDDEYQPNRTNKDHFENLKAQQWQNVADRLLHTYNAVTKGNKFDPDMIISISSDCNQLEDLKIELSSPKKDKSKRGLVKVESKDDLKKRGIPSPNIADAFIMRYFKTETIDWSRA